MISIVMPAYNGEKYISEAIESVLNQTLTEWELLVVVDQKSSDQTAVIAKKYSERDSRIIVFENVQTFGVVANRNFALTKVRGEYISFLDCDDRWHPQKLEKQLKFMTDKKAAFSFHAYQVMNENGELTGQVRIVPTRVSREDLLRDNKIGCLSVVIRKDLLGESKFVERRHEDLFLWLELLKKCGEASGLNEVLADYRVSGKSLSGNKVKSAVWRWQLYRDLRVPLFKAIWYWFNYSILGVLKRLR